MGWVEVCVPCVTVLLSLPSQLQKGKKDSLTGNRTRVARVTGGNTNPYTIKDEHMRRRENFV